MGALHAVQALMVLRALYMCRYVRLTRGAEVAQSAVVLCQQTGELSFVRVWALRPLTLSTWDIPCHKG